MSNFSLLNLIENALESRSGERLTANQLSRVIVEENPKWAQKKQENSQNHAIRDGGFEELRAQVQSEIGSNRSRIEKHPNIRMTADKPRRYYFTKLTDEEQISEIENDPNGHTSGLISEHDLYPLLAEYLITELGVFAKRIDENRSKNKNGPKGNHWLHPDLIGFQALSENWGDTIRTLVQARSDPNSRLWSFEVKKLVNRANVREVFFQALSNSAWANYAYLVAAEISGSGTFEELRMLSSQHGVGLIILGTSADTESSIAIQATERPEVDWTAANRLAEENQDADAVFRQVRVYHQAGELTKEFWKS